MDSMEHIYKQYAQIVYGFLLSRTGNPHLAEELTQETFYRAIKASKSYRGEGSVSTWLCGIAKRVWYEYIRKQRKESPWMKRRKYCHHLWRKKFSANGTVWNC